MWTEGDFLKSGRYQVLDPIGGGGFGLTSLAKDTHLERFVVIKTPNQQFQTDQDYEKFVRRFNREGQALAKINHSNIVQVYDCFDQDGMPCLVMAYVDGETLNERVRNKGKLSPDEAVCCFRKLAGALHHLHQKGLIHCDVHPGNIILQLDDEPVLIDFGSAKMLRPSTFTVTTTLNEYTPFEQEDPENKPGSALDTYALAATLYFAVTGQKPQASTSRKMFGDRLVPPHQHCEEIEAWLNQAILQGMALEAEHRPASMQAWIDLLQPPNPPRAKSSQPQQPTSGRAEQPVPLEPPHFRKVQVPATPRAKSRRLPRATPGSTDQPVALRLTVPSRKVQHRQTRTFPWMALGYLLIGYIPIGLILGFSYDWIEAEIWVGAVAWATAGAAVWAGTVASAGDSGVNWVGGIVAWTLGGAWAVVVAWNGATAWAWPWPWAVTWVVAGALAGVLALLGTAGGAFAWDRAFRRSAKASRNGTWAGTWASLVGGVIGSFTGIGFWQGLGTGLLAFIQFWFVLEGLAISEESFRSRYQKSSIFTILSSTSALGLAIGGALGWWLGLSGFRLPN